MPQHCIPPPPAWLPLAEAAIAKLRQHGTVSDTPAPAAKHPGRSRSMTPILRDAQAVDRLPPDFRDELTEVGADPDAINPITWAHQPAVWISPQRLLLAIRLAALFGSRQGLDAWLAPSAVSVISGVDDVDLLRQTLRRGYLPATWRTIERASDADTQPALAAIAPEITSGRVTPAARARFAELVEESLDAREPVLIALPDGVHLPEDLGKLLPSALPLPTINREILIALLRYTHSATGRIDEAAVRSALPDDRALARLSRAQLQWLCGPTPRWPWHSSSSISAHGNPRRPPPPLRLWKI